jgi:hypothetical protein
MGSQATVTESEAEQKSAPRSETSLGRKPAGLSSREESANFAAALALATVFAFAAHIARVAAAFAFATILAFAVVFIGGGGRGGYA